MFHFGCGCGIWRRTHTRLIGIQAAFDTLHHGGRNQTAEETACSRIEVERVGENLIEHIRNQGNIGSNDEECYDEI